VVRDWYIVYVVLSGVCSQPAGGRSRQREFSGMYINSKRVINIVIFNQPVENEMSPLNRTTSERNAGKKGTSGEVSFDVAKIRPSVFTRLRFARVTFQAGYLF